MAQEWTPTKLSPAELSDWEQKVKLQQMNFKQRAAWMTKMDQENLEELENVFLELAQTLVATTFEEPSGAAINLRSVNSQPPVPDELVIAVAKVDLFEGVLQHPSQFTGFLQVPANSRGTIGTFWHNFSVQRMVTSLRTSTGERILVVIVPLWRIGEFLWFQTWESGSTNGGAGETCDRNPSQPLVFRKNATSHQVLLRSDFRQGAWVGSTDYRRCGGMPSGRIRENVFGEGSTAARGHRGVLHCRHAHLRPWSTGPIRTNDLVSHGWIRPGVGKWFGGRGCFSFLRPLSSFHCIHELKRILEGPRAGNKIALFESECWCHVHFGHISTQNTVLLLLFFWNWYSDINLLPLDRLFSCCPVIVPTQLTTVHRFDA